MIQKVAIQGYEGSFHQIAAQQYFGKQVQVITCASFSDVIKTTINKNKSDAGVMAIENSIVGSILPNYTLLQKSNLVIVGEVYLKIKQHLLVNKGVCLQDIKEVHSHPMALLQCSTFLEKQSWKLIETEDTALSAKFIQQHKSKHIAAVGSALAANLYQLNILAPSIQTTKNNYTRFLILQKKDIIDVPIYANKASINFHTNHLQGSLAKVLMLIANEGINLSKLQSLPIPGSNFEYSFYADMEFTSLSIFYHTIEKMKLITQSLRVYGVYKNGKG